MVYQGALIVLFSAIAFYVGPSYLLFHKFTWISPSDFVPKVERDCIPIVSAMKAYRRDHGYLPNRWEDICPVYIEIKNHGDPATIYAGKFHSWTMFNHTIEYDFSPDTEGWSVRGPFTHGRIPAPLAAMGPATLPATQPLR